MLLSPYHHFWAWTDCDDSKFWVEGTSNSTLTTFLQFTRYLSSNWNNACYGTSLLSSMNAKGMTRCTSSPIQDCLWILTLVCNSWAGQSEQTAKQQTTREDSEWTGNTFPLGSRSPMWLAQLPFLLPTY